MPSISESLSDEFGNLTNRSVNNAVFASLPVELRDAYLRGMELQREYDDSIHEERSYRQTYGTLEEMRVKLENSTSAIELYSGIENSARKSLLEWAKIADETSKDTPDSNITQNNNEHILPDERITEIYKTLSYLRKKAQVLVLSCRPDQEKLERIDQLSKILSRLKEETEIFPPVDAVYYVSIIRKMSLRMLVEMLF